MTLCVNVDETAFELEITVEGEVRYYLLSRPKRLGRTFWIALFLGGFTALVWRLRGG